MSKKSLKPCIPLYGSCALFEGHRGPHHGYPENIAAIRAEARREAFGAVLKMIAEGDYPIEDDRASSDDIAEGVRMLMEKP